MQESMRFSYRWLAWLCLSLMLWTAVAESTHNHSNNTESASCSICRVAHSASPAASCHHARPLFAAMGVLQQEDVTAKAQISIFELDIRGPPAV
jgi:hypothetical protein